MKVFNGFGPDGSKATGIRFERDDANHWSAWDSSLGDPQTHFNVERAFCSMLTTARIVADGFREGKPIDGGDEIAPIRNLYLWQNTCRRYIEKNLIELRAARWKIPSPADLPGTQNTSFCELALLAVDHLTQELFHFVTTRGDEIPQVQAASDAGRSLDTGVIHATDLLRLVIKELNKLNWTAEQWTMRKLVERTGISDDTLRRHIHGTKSRGKRPDLSKAVVAQMCRSLIGKSPTEAHKVAAKSLLAELGQ